MQKPLGATMTTRDNAAPFLRQTLLEGAVGDLADDLDRTEYIDRLEEVIDSRAGHYGWWAKNKHPLDRAAELEEERLAKQRTAAQ